MMINSAPAMDCRGDRDAKGNAFDPDRIGGHQLQRKLILRDGHDGASRECARHEQVQRGEQHKRGDAGHQHAQGEIDITEVQARPDVARLDITIVDAEDEDEHHLGHEQQAEKKGEAAQKFLAPLFKRQVIDLVDKSAEQIEHRQHHNADYDGVDAERDIDDVGDVGPENDERRMRDVDNVEHAEGNRDTGRDGGVKAAEQEPRDNGIHQEIEGNIHTRLNRRRCRRALPDSSPGYDARPRSVIELPALLPSEAFAFLLSHSSRPAATDFAALCRKAGGLASLLNDQPNLCKRRK